MKAVFKKMVKYKGVYYAAGSQIPIASEEKEAMLKNGAIIIEDDGMPKSNEKEENDKKVPKDKNLHEMNLSELKDLAKSKGIEGYSVLKKEELIALLEDAD